MSVRPRIVVDTNVWLSALVFGGIPRCVVELFVHGTVEVVLSEEIFTEMRRKVASKFPDFASDLARMELLLCNDAETVKLGEITITICRDPGDNRILETAVVGGCDYIVTGDKDLLTLGIYKGIRIMKPADFLTVLARGGL